MQHAAVAQHSVAVCVGGGGGGGREGGRKYVWGIGRGGGGGIRGDNSNLITT